MYNVSAVIQTESLRALILQSFWEIVYKGKQSLKYKHRIN